MALGIKDAARIISALVMLAENARDILWIESRLVRRLDLPQLTKEKQWYGIQQHLVKSNFVCAFSQEEPSNRKSRIMGIVVFRSDGASYRTSEPVASLSRIVANPDHFCNQSITRAPVSLSIDREMIVAEIKELEVATAVYNSNVKETLSSALRKFVIT